MLEEKKVSGFVEARETGNRATMVKKKLSETKTQMTRKPRGNRAREQPENLGNQKVFRSGGESGHMLF